MDGRARVSMWRWNYQDVLFPETTLPGLGCGCTDSYPGRSTRAWSIPPVLRETRGPGTHPSVAELSVPRENSGKSFPESFSRRSRHIPDGS